MPLQPGTTLGPYTVTAKIGEGGMGEVYRARDTKLDRDVALKVLPQAFTDDPDRLARFEREAKVLASLNHPNIGHIYGLEEAEGSTQSRAHLARLLGPPLLQVCERLPNNAQRFPSLCQHARRPRDWSWPEFSTRSVERRLSNYLCDRECPLVPRLVIASEGNPNLLVQRAREEWRRVARIDH